MAIGAPGIADMAWRLEQAGRLGDTTTARGLVDQLQAGLRQLAAEVTTQAV